MRDFLAAQADDPSGPAPMLIQADHLEEHGDQVGAEVLRSLAAAGIPSLISLALTGTLVSSIKWADHVEFSSARGCWFQSGDGCLCSDFGMTEPLSGHGVGAGDHFWLRRETEVDSGDHRIPQAFAH